MQEIKNELVELNVEGMTCSNCALGITKFLEQKGLKNVYVNFATNEVRFALNGQKDLTPIINGINQLGYHVVDDALPESTIKRKLRFNSLEIKFIISAIFTLPLLFSMIPALHILHQPLVQFILCLPVYLIGFFHFGKSAWSSLKTRVPNMDVLIFIGSSSAFIYSMIGLVNQLGMNYLFFETCASIITLVLLGNLLEHRSVRQTTTAIKELSDLQPEKAKRIRFDLMTGQEEIDVTDVKSLIKNERVIVNTGDKIPLDGKIIFGEALIDESMLTGESIPVTKNKDAIVTGGTLVIDGSIKIQITATSENSVLASIIKLVKDAQADKPPIQKLADKISAIFVPAVLIISAITFVVSYFLLDISISHAIMRSIAVLVIACPCAMGLATPTAIMVGIGRAAKNGLLMKGASTLESFAKSDIIVFDKTGTLTTGNFSVTGLKIYQGDENEISSIINQLEKTSSHPIAQSLVKYFTNHNSIQIVNTKELKGIGVTGSDQNGNQYAIGSSKINAKSNLPEHDIYLFKNNELAAGFDIADEIKPHAADLISYFKSENLHPVLLSGDNEKKCRFIAEELNIETYYASQSPADKLERIHQLTQNHIVSMVGDGINDSPSLEKAHVGISFSDATQIAMNSASIILLNGDLNQMKKAHQLGRMTLKTIKQNLFWAFFYNIIAIPIAAVGLLSPIIAAGSMAFSDVFVIGNSILLRFRKMK